MDDREWLDDVRRRYARTKRRAEDAAGQVGDDDFFRELGGNPNSIAVVMKHVGGNLRSRWRDFLTTDGEKADRHRDTEFVAASDDRAAVLADWAAGWDVATRELDALEPADLARTITIRGEPLSVVQAIQRNLDHLVYHTGQIVTLARAFCGDSWRTQSVPRGKSDAHNATMRARHGDWLAPGFRPRTERGT